MRDLYFELEDIKRAMLPLGRALSAAQQHLLCIDELERREQRVARKRASIVARRQQLYRAKHIDDARHLCLRSPEHRARVAARRDAEHRASVRQRAEQAQLDSQRRRMDCLQRAGLWQPWRSVSEQWRDLVASHELAARAQLPPAPAGWRWLCVAGGITPDSQRYRSEWALSPAVR